MSIGGVGCNDIVFSGNTSFEDIVVQNITGNISADSITLNGVTIDDWSDVNSSSGSSIWDDVSDVATYNGNVNITGNISANYIGLLGYNPESPIHYEGEPNVNELIKFKYGRGSSAASPFYYDVYIPQTVSTGTQIMAIVNARVYSERTSAGNQYLYGNYIKLGTTAAGGVRHLSGNQYYTFDDVDIITPTGSFGVPSSSVQEFRGHDYSLSHGVSLAVESGTEYMSGGRTTYSTKANNILGGSRTYETYGYHTKSFEGCQSYDNCYGFYAESSDSKFDGDVEIVDELTVQDLVTGGNAGTSLCVDTNNKLCLCGSCA